MFVLRCAFFLSIVYVGIFNGWASVRGPQVLGPAVTGEVSEVADAVVARAAEWCAERPVQCARDAARLDALVQSTAFEAAPVVDNAAPAVAEVRSAPLPVPDPRRRVNRPVLTDAR